MYPVSYLKDKVEQVRSLGLLVEAEPVGGIVQEDDLGRELVHPRPALITPHFVHASLHIQTRVVCQPRAQLMYTHSNAPVLQIEHNIRCRSGKGYPEHALELQTDEKNVKMCQILSIFKWFENLTVRRLSGLSWSQEYRNIE
jgi:hypothetical protein